MKVAIYARMSTDKQSERSPEDQVSECREFAQRQGWNVVDDLVVKDAGISGASRHNRPRLLELMARIAEWDVLLCWDFDRLARDSEDLGWIRNRLRAQRRTAVAVSTGLDLFNVGAKVLGVFAEEYLVKLRADTRRGLKGRATQGLSTGGLAFGYRSEPVACDAQGRPIDRDGFSIAIAPDRAAVVRRIFREYLEGAGLREIAHRLNGEGILSPRQEQARRKGRATRANGWAPSALHELLRNPIYKGERIFNRSEWVKDHETGRRRRFERPESEWIRQAAPELAILEPQTFEAVQEEARRRGRRYVRGEGGRRLAGTLPGLGHPGPTRYVLSGLLECGACGGGFHAQNGAERYGCGWHRDRGPVVCESTLMVPRKALEERIFGALRDRILVPENVAYAVEKALGLVKRQLRSELGPTAAERARLAELDEELSALRRLAERGRRVEVAPLIRELEAERGRLTSPRRGIAARVDLEAIRPRIEDLVLEMREAFAGAPEERRRAFRALLGDRRMRVLPDDERRFRVEGLFELPLETADARPLEGTGRLHSQVAGGGFEPPTSGL